MKKEITTFQWSMAKHALNGGLWLNKELTGYKTEYLLQHLRLRVPNKQSSVQEIINTTRKLEKFFESSQIKNRLKEETENELKASGASSGSYQVYILSSSNRNELDQLREHLKLHVRVLEGILEY